ncbi:hypothetical protein NEPAR06_0669 [Nematocida parisii]|uniref:Sm protein B n=1 Tax=Nematocida parisii (strain ERTm3) TaxID=935791 RepID=I3EHV7_NEMP3|nr:uncharacterized protein NEPG_02403 [Nematocida parisii ERTm1]EIJ88804.1 hypothetical protein NEQG_00623 [Nematocida parisii ERTm3]KAI5125783.1 hypothetical protein NEPAR03_0220 [Nematocida parisii]EIJ92712.1 hypothetical protein NEPG_02403 [Nematocida parisii ERTm1]KAI5126718.1 hypothetical protein NEPAR08_0570 [Nematocida parisii]KAI5140906.1 hypothetical protein NEPAR04_0567 [Nematocida parisii]|eukprot:XP_013060230.1 hypothetical protein NEPG_02403 [Nematocida parisii ERTm1]
MDPLLSEESLHSFLKSGDKVCVTVKGNREVVGTMELTDKHMNVLLRDAVETRTQLPSMLKGKKRQIKKVFTRTLGNVFIRGETVIAISAEE